MKKTLKVLIVDDNGEKCQSIATVVNSSGQAVDIDTVTTIAGARKSLALYRYDLVILDILLPPRPGEPESANECEGLLSDIGKERRMQKPRALIGITAFSTQYEKIYPAFATYGWLLYNYELQRETWTRLIADQLRFLADTSSDLATAPSFQSDVAVVTALATPELAAILELPLDWKATKVENDYTEYHEGFLDVGEKRLKVIAAATSQMGLVAATTLSLKICSAFKPRLLVMVGIAAGVRGRTNFGDILVAEESWDYNSGKLGNTEDHASFQADPKSIRIPPEISGVFQNPKRNAQMIGRAFESWRGNLPPERPNVRIGPVASGSSVVASADKVHEIQQHNRKLIGLEMETYGVYFAANHVLAPKPRYLSIKSVCDFADDQKHDGFQAYASHMSSRYLLEILSDGTLLAAIGI